MSLVAAYASDSEDEQPPVVPQAQPSEPTENEEIKDHSATTSGAASLASSSRPLQLGEAQGSQGPEEPQFEDELHIQKCSNSGLSSGLKLPPPKHMLHAGLPPPKKAPHKRQIRVEITHEDTAQPAPAPIKKPRTDTMSNGSSHSLLGSLPAPQNKAPVKPPPSEVEPETALDDDMRLSIQDTGAEKSSRGNEDFRAMLGLKPRTDSNKPSGRKAVILQEPKAPADTPEQHHESPTSTGSSHATLLSAAPDVAEKPEPEPEPEPEPMSYPGWRCDPDGSWYPVTPEAHAAYAAWAQQAQETEALAAQARDMPRDTSRLAVLDARAELDQAHTIRPPEPKQTKPEREFLVSEKLQSERFTNFRAKTRGQLTTLLAMAHERRGELEERWSRGKSKMRENRKRYGF